MEHCNDWNNLNANCVCCIFHGVVGACVFVLSMDLTYAWRLDTSSSWMCCITWIRGRLQPACQFVTGSLIWCWTIILHIFRLQHNVTTCLMHVGVCVCVFAFACTIIDTNRAVQIFALHKRQQRLLNKYINAADVCAVYVVSTPATNTTSRNHC